MDSYITDADRAEYRRFCLSHLRTYDRPPVKVWHYTTAEGMIGILQGGQIFATHISCVNDNSEHR
jgi:hypothetical protein